MRTAEEAQPGIQGKMSAGRRHKNNKMFIHILSWASHSHACLDQRGNIYLPSCLSFPSAPKHWEQFSPLLQQVNSKGEVFFIISLWLYKLFLLWCQMPFLHFDSDISNIDSFEELDPRFTDAQLQLLLLLLDIMFPACHPIFLHHLTLPLISPIQPTRQGCKTSA